MNLNQIALSTSLALGTAIAGVGSTALAQATSPSASARTQQQNESFERGQARGTISRFVVGPFGHVRGFALNDGKVIYVGDQRGDQIAQRLHVGQEIRADGYMTADNPNVIFNPTVLGPDGAQIVAARPVSEMQAMRSEWHNPETRARMRGEMHQREAQLTPQTANGTVQTVLSGAKGQIHGVLLSDGSTVFLRPTIAQELEQHGGIRVGENLQIRGRGGVYPQGMSLIADEVTLPDGTHLQATQSQPRSNMQSPGMH